MGLRPSLFADIGSVFGTSAPPLINSPLPNGLFIPIRNTAGQLQYVQVQRDNSGNIISGSGTLVTNQIAPDGTINTLHGDQLPAFVEEFYGNSSRPRLSVGAGVNWNSPFGPFRIDLAYDVLSQIGDQTKTLSFNVGAAF